MFVCVVLEFQYSFCYSNKLCMLYGMHWKKMFNVDENSVTRRGSFLLANLFFLNYNDSLIKGGC